MGVLTEDPESVSARISSIVADRDADAAPQSLRAATLPRAERITDVYRAHYGSAIAGAGYNGLRHAAWVAGAATGLIAALLHWAPAAGAMQWSATVVASLLIANLVEYWTHRGPMHRPTRWLRPMYDRHARRHHRYFAHGRMEIRSHRDLHAVLFPPVLFLFFAAVALALGTLMALTLSTTIAFGFAISCTIYYLSYEALHLFYHLRDAERVPVLGYLARLHRIHHNSRKGSLTNFNLVFPLCDLIFGTLDHAPRDQAINHQRGQRQSGTSNEALKPE